MSSNTGKKKTHSIMFMSHMSHLCQSKHNHEATRELQQHNKCKHKQIHGLTC